MSCRFDIVVAWKNEGKGRKVETRLDPGNFPTPPPSELREKLTRWHAATTVQKKDIARSRCFPPKETYTVPVFRAD